LQTDKLPTLACSCLTRGRGAGILCGMAGESLGTRIRRARERKRLSQQELAEAVGASLRAVGDWENDRRKPRNRTGALEEILGVSLDEDTGPPPPRLSDATRQAMREELGPELAARLIAEADHASSGRTSVAGGEGDRPLGSGGRSRRSAG